jgi:hypothetical protein
VIRVRLSSQTSPSSCIHFLDLSSVPLQLVCRCLGSCGACPHNKDRAKRKAPPGAIARAAPQQEAPKTNEAESFRFFDRGAKVPTVKAKAMETYRAAFETIAKTRAEEIRQQVIEEAEAVYIDKTDG